jgi:hypothetical protein
MIRLLFILFLLIFTGQSEQDPVEKGSSKPGKYFNNPVFDGADPWMIQKDGYYYYCFSSGNGISVSRSGFITRRDETRKVWQAPASGWNNTEKTVGGIQDGKETAKGIAITMKNIIIIAINADAQLGIPVKSEFLLLVFIILII